MKELLIQYAPLSIWWLGYFGAVMLIGWMVWSWLMKLVRHRWSLPDLNNPWLTVLVWLMSGFTTIGLASIPLYIARGSALWLTGGVIALLLIAFFLMLQNVWHRRSDLERLMKRFCGAGYSFKFHIRSTVLVVALALLAVFVLVDSMISAARLSYILDGSDANVHLSRMVDMMHNGMSIRDGFMQGVDETRYAINFVYSLFIPLLMVTKALGYAPYEVAAVTPVFFRLLQIVAIGALAFGVAQLLFFRKKRDRGWCYAISASAVIVGMLLNHFAFSFYPNVVVFAWYVVLFFALLWQSSKAHQSLARILLILAALAIAGTHATYAIMAGLLIALVQGVYFIEDIIRRRSPLTRELWVSFLAVTLLLLPGVFVFLQPNLMTEQAVNTESGAASLLLFGVRVFPPRLGFTSDMIWNFVQAIGLMGLIWAGFRSSARVGVVMVTVLGVSLITASNPLFVATMDALHIPYWVISRFPAINIFLTYNLPIVFGGVCLMLGVWWVVKRTRSAALRIVTTTGCLVLTAGVLLAIGQSALQVQRQAWHWTKQNYVALETFRRIDREVMSHIGSRQLVLASHYTSYYLPVVKPSTVVYTDALHMPPGGDADNRQQCQNQLLAQLNAPDVVRGAGINWVVIDPYQGEKVTEERLSALRSHPEDYIEVSGPGVYRVFRVQAGSVRTTASCQLFQQREAGQR